MSGVNSSSSSSSNRCSSPRSSTASCGQARATSASKPGTTRGTAKLNATEKAVVDAVSKLVQQKFRGNWKDAFGHYASGPKQVVEKKGVKQLLGDAKPDTWFSHDLIAGRLMDRFDSDRSGGVSWGEFQGGMRSVGVAL